MLSTGIWTLTSLDTSHVHGQKYTSRQWSHHRPHLVRRMQDIIIDSDLAYLRSHIDRDFTMSIVQAHIDKHVYQVDDKILCYFAFPRIGVAVALWPGNFLLFNPQEPHSISSRCRKEDDFFAFHLT
jgi:hypothetical protein